MSVELGARLCGQENFSKTRAISGGTTTDMRYKRSRITWLGLGEVDDVRSIQHREVADFPDVFAETRDVGLAKAVPRQLVERSAAERQQPKREREPAGVRIASHKPRLFERRNYSDDARAAAVEVTGKLVQAETTG